MEESYSTPETTFRSLIPFLLTTFTKFVKWIDEDCTLTLRELQAMLLQRRHKIACKETIRKAILGFGYTVKRVTLTGERGETEENWGRRRVHAEWFIQQEILQQDKLLFLDESPFRIELRRRYGRSKKGEPARVKVPALKTRSVSVMACMGVDGMKHYKAPLQGNTAGLLKFLGELFAKLPGPGYTIILDNASFHRSAAVKQLVEGNGHFLQFLPPYSPFFNPIENFFNQWKNFVRRSRPRTEFQLDEAIRTVDQRLTPATCANYYRHTVDNCMLVLEGHRNLN
jgi:hypothetical protein